MELNEKKIKILEVAEELFANSGFSGTSVREIAKKSGVNVAMISYYFESKEKLLEAIFHYRSDYLQTKIENLINDENLSNWQKLDLLIDEYVQKFANNKTLHCIILREHALNKNSNMRQFINERKYKHYQIMVRFIKQGQADGDFNTGIDLLMIYTLLPAVTKHMLFNEDFMKRIITEEEGKEAGDTDLQERTKNYLKMTLRQILETNKG